MLNSPFSKFVTPALLALFATVMTAITEGEFDLSALEVGFFGLASAIASFLVVNGPTGIRRYAKALAPAVLALVGIGLHTLFTGDFNESDTRAAIVMGLSAVVTFIVPNTSGR